MVKSVINNLSASDVRLFNEMCGYADSVDPNGNALDLYQRLATKSAIYPGRGTPLGLAYVALKLNGEAGEVAEHVGKAMRDDELMRAADESCIDTETGWHSATDALTPERHTLLRKEGGDVLWYLSALCNELGITLSDLAAENLQKLADRTERNALRGSGDNR